MESTKSLIRRCVHSVFLPSDVRDTEANPVCSVCRSRMIFDSEPVSAATVRLWKERMGMTDRQLDEALDVKLSQRKPSDEEIEETEQPQEISNDERGEIYAESFD